jgi:uncharacterized damage-inducible protein DinB
MYTSEAMLDFHERAHRSLQKLMGHCRQLSPEELDRELPGFGYPSARLQLHHTIGAEEYWVGVLKGHFEVRDDDADYPTIESLEGYRQRVYSATEEYLQSASTDELNTPGRMITWGNKERVLIPAHVLLRTQTHIFQHQGQIQAMCRLMGKPASGLDFPLD